MKRKRGSAAELSGNLASPVRKAPSMRFVVNHRVARVRLPICAHAASARHTSAAVADHPHKWVGLPGCGRTQELGSRSVKRTVVPAPGALSISHYLPTRAWSWREFRSLNRNEW